MALYVRNTSGSDVTLAAPATPVVVVANGTEKNVTSELQGLTGPQYTALEGQRVGLGGGLVYWWETCFAEFPTGALTVLLPATTSDVQAVDSYTPAVPTDWGLPLPTEIHGALDTLAAPRVNVAVYANSTTGNDSNDGATPATAVQTLGRALELVPGAWSGRCRINLASGSYTWPLNVTVGRPIEKGEPVTIIGTMIDSGLGTRTATAVTTPAAPAAHDRWNIQDNTLAMGVDAYVGYTLRFTTGTNAGWRYTITTNTVDTFELLAGKTTPAPIAGNQFVVEKQDSTIDWTTPAGETSVTNDQYLAFRNVRFVINNAVNWNRCYMRLDGIWVDAAVSGLGRIWAYASMVEIGSLRDPHGDPSSNAAYSDLELQTDAFGGGMYATYLRLCIYRNTNLSASVLVFRSGMAGLTALHGGTAIVTGVDFNTASALSMYAYGFSSISVGSTPGYGPYSTILATGGGGPVARATDLSSLTLFATQIRNSYGATGDAVNIQSQSYGWLYNVLNLDAASTRYGVTVDKNSTVLLGSGTTVTGAIAELRCDSYLGTHAANAVNGIVGTLGSQINRGVPVTTFKGAFNATQNNMKGYGQIAAGASSLTITNNLVTTASFVRASTITDAAAPNEHPAVRSVVAGAGNFTVYLVAPVPAGQTLKFVWELIEY